MSTDAVAAAVKRYRAKRRAEGAKRLEVQLSAEQSQKLDRLATHLGLSRQGALRRLLEWQWI